MNVIAIRFARLGDVALLLPALAQIKAALPGCRLTLLTGHRCAPLARMCPALDEVIPVDRVSMKAQGFPSALGPIWRVIADLRRRQFDAVVDFHGLRETALLAWVSGAGKRLGLKRWGQSSLPMCYNLPLVVEDKSLHVSRMFEVVAGRFCDAGRLLPQPDGASVFSIAASDQEWWRLEYSRHHSRQGGAPYVALNLDAPVRERLWPLERFAAFGDAMIERHGAAVVVLAGTGKSAMIEEYLRLTRYPERTAGYSDLSIARLASIIESARLFVSNDTGPMHLGALLRVPTLGLFSVGLPEHFRPIGPGGDFLRANPIDRIEAGDVTERAEAMWVTAGPGLRR